MARGKDRNGRSGDRDRKTGAMALPADLECSLRHLDDAQLDRLREAAAAEARRRGLRDGRKTRPEARRQPTPVTAGQQRLVVAAHEAGLRPAAIAQEFRLSRAQVDDVLAAAKQRRR